MLNILPRFERGGIFYGEPPGGVTGVPVVPVTNADSGVSIGPVGTVILGNQPLFSVTDATLLDDATIPLGGFNLILAGIGLQPPGAGLGFPGALNLNLDATAPISNPQIIFNTPGGSEIGRITITNDAAPSIFIGQVSGNNYSLTTGGANTALGTAAMGGLLTGTRNTAVGFGAMSAAGMDGASFNTAVGQEALSDVSDGGIGGGNENTAVGRNAGQTVTTGSQNTLIGGEINTLGGTATDNTVVGFSGGGATGLQQQKNQNTFIGSQNLITAPAYGNTNTIVGFSNFAASQVIGATNIVVGSNNTVTGAALTNNNIIIGNNVNFSTGTVTNSIIINTGTAAYNLRIPNVVVIGSTTQNTLIGPATPVATNIASQRLQVNGNIGGFHLVGNGAAPTAAPGSGIITTALTGTDMAGSVTIVTGVSPVPANTVVCTITYNVPYITQAYPNITPANANAAVGLFYIINTGPASFQISNSVALVPTNPYILIYHITG